MKISVPHLKHIFDNYGDALDIKYFDDVVIKGSCFLSSDIVLADHMGRLVENGINEIEIFYDKNIYDILSKEFPEKYRKPFGRMNYTEMDRHLETLSRINSTTRRRRYAIMVGDTYGIDMNKGGQVILIHNNEPMDYRKWNDLKRKLNRNQAFLYRNSECKIIIFVDLSGATEKGFVERFKINTDLISLMVSKSVHEFAFADDFIPTEDVISVTEPAILLEEYIRSNARLIIIGEKPTESYKLALREVKKYDKFVRMMVIPVLNRSNIDHLLQQVKLVYNYDRWT